MQPKQSRGDKVAHRDYRVSKNNQSHTEGKQSKRERGPCTVRDLLAPVSFPAISHTGGDREGEIEIYREGAERKIGGR